MTLALVPIVKVPVLVNVDPLAIVAVALVPKVKGPVWVNVAPLDCSQCFVDGQSLATGDSKSAGIYGQRHVGIKSWPDYS